MKTILCYGDSNTWGLDYITGGRVPFEERWPNVMQRELGSPYQVIEEGVNGRTTAEDDPTDEYPEAKNGEKYLIPCLRSHYPLDLVIFMLGTNDLKVQFFTTVGQIAENIGRLVETTRKELQSKQNRVPGILVVSPMAVGNSIEMSPFCVAFGGRKAIVPSMELAKALGKETQRLSCPFLDAASIAQPNRADAIHFTKEGHRRFGRAVAEKVKEIIG